MPDRVGGYTEVIDAAPTVDLAVYAAGELIGAKLTFTNACRFASPQDPGSGLVISCVITDAAKQDVPLDLVLFDADPTNTTFTDQAAFAIDDADLGKVIGVVNVVTWHDFSNNSVGTAFNLTIPFQIGTARNLFGALVSRGAPDFVATDDINVRLGIIQD